jgi:hypothetical protein
LSVKDNIARIACFSANASIRALREGANMSLFHHFAVPGLALALLGACTTPPATTVAREPTCSIAGAWADTVTGLGQSVWTISSDGAAAETGMHSATGRASVDGHVLRLTASTTSGFTGDYEITLDASCSAGEGRLTWTRAPAGVELRSFPVTFTRRGAGVG